MALHVRRFGADHQASTSVSTVVLNSCGGRDNPFFAQNVCWSADRRLGNDGFSDHQPLEVLGRVARAGGDPWGEDVVERVLGVAR